jgi:transglutaminase-like putative cysteine protease
MLSDHAYHARPNKGSRVDRFKRWVSLAALVASMAGARAAGAEVRRFELRYEARLEAPAAATAGDVDLWLPLVEDNAQQSVRFVRVEGGEGAEVVHDARYGNAALHLRRRAPAAVAITYVVERRDETHDLAALPARADTPAAPGSVAADPDLARWLVPDRLGAPLPQVQAYAARATAGRTTPLARARGIYDFVVDLMSYDKSGTGWGRGDLVWVCDARRGNCTDFHALFMAMARVAGIPSRFEIGLPLPDARGAGEIPGYHCWVHFWIDGLGWLPIDASEAKKHPEKRERFFGGHDENRVQLSVGRDIRFPGMAGELGTFVHPYAEAAGKPVDVAHRYSFRDLPAAPAPAPPSAANRPAAR